MCRKMFSSMGLLLLLLFFLPARPQQLETASVPPPPSLPPRPSSTPTTWRCPLSSADGVAVSCACDLPHTLRCSGGDRSALVAIANALRGLPPSSAVSLLDCTVANVTSLPASMLQGVALHGLVVSSGEIKRVAERAFDGLASPLLALGLPNNALAIVPAPALALLPQLERLDLSHNHLRALDGNSFKGLIKLTFLDLSDNAISRVTPGVLAASLPALRTLRMRGTRLDAANASGAVRGLSNLHELDLSGNAVKGPLSPDSLPPLPSLRTLSLARNNLTSVKKGALSGLPSLTILSLAHNQIDVLEDHAFLHFGALSKLDLSHNRVVTVSGSSLAHLSRLTTLDLAHNFLRALTVDLIAPLKSLRELRVDDNDISMVLSGALRGATSLRNLTLSDNPLNCDCNMLEFADWLVNGSMLSPADQATAVCATPPSLENGLLVEVPPGELLCGADEDAMEQNLGPAAAGLASLPNDEDPASSPPLPPVSSARLKLHRFQYDGFRIALEWAVEETAAPYACDALYVYEEVGAHEVLLESSPLHCNSSALRDATRLAVALPSVDLQPGHKYRYCVVLLESGDPRKGEAADEVSLVLGCSEVIPLVPTTEPVLSPPAAIPPPDPDRLIDTFDANATTSGSVSVFARVSPDGEKGNCELTVAVFVEGIMVAQRRLECPAGRASFAGLPAGPYRVCAGLGTDVTPRGRCVTVRAAPGTGDNAVENLALAIGLIVLTGVLLTLLYVITRHLIHRPKCQGQYFMSGTREDQQHPRYVKLQATTKV
ncbi:hypothetical protein J437_LFUL012004 [Ladona fulva]|uniref:LRRCT domain-containing protein n=1 Tax=Ladona fulva TaxID=123851 RepID=A0A8K0P4I8_LADFU|nr:hypothetical protein J437_LFUL012004 [Ladona fulva]